MVAPLPETGRGGDLLAVVHGDGPARPGRERRARRCSFPVAALTARARARSSCAIGDVVADRPRACRVARAATGARCAWDLQLGAAPAGLRSRAPGAARAPRIAKTILFLPHPDVEVAGSDRDRTAGASRSRGARGGQAHLWGSKHAHALGVGALQRLHRPDGEPRPDTFVDGVSVFVPRFGREIGPNTPVVARVGGRGPALDRAARACSATRASSTSTSWRFEARARRRKLAGEVTRAPRGPASASPTTTPTASSPTATTPRSPTCASSCSSATAPCAAGASVDELRSDGRAHFEYAQREPVDGRRGSRCGDATAAVAAPFAWRQRRRRAVDRGRRCPARGPRSARGAAASARRRSTRSTSAS